MIAQPGPKGSIARAARVLDVLAQAPDGAALAEIASLSRFNKSTTHRLLGSLQDINYVFQEPASRAYRLGSKLAELGWTAARADVAAVADRGLHRLAELSEDTVFLSIPEGAVAVCAARAVGAFPIRTLTLDKGDRRPLGVGAGSLALYCALPDAEREAACRVNRNWLAEYGFSKDILEQEHAAFAARGYAQNRGRVVPGMSAIALPVVTASGRLAAAIAIGAIEERMDTARIEAKLLPALKRETKQLAKHLSTLEREHGL